MNARRRIYPFGLLLLLAMLIAPLPASSAAPPTDLTPEARSPDANNLALPTNQIIIKYRPAARLDSATGGAGPDSAAQLARLSETAGTPLTYFRPMSGDAHVLRLPARLALAEVQALADRLSALPEVLYAEPDAIMRPMLEPNDPHYGEQWHYATPAGDHYGINAPPAWDVTTGSASIVVAVVDTGITNHADLSGRTVAGYDFISDPWTANDGDGRDADPSDPGDWVAAGDCDTTSPPEDSSWHGTHVAGTIGAASNNGIGVAGVNWNSRIQPVRVLGRCGGMISDIADGMRWAAGLAVPGVPNNSTPAKVINASLGGSGTCGSTYQDAINAIIGAGVTPVIAAGNSNDNAALYRPGNCNGVITVAATNRTGSRAFYSNFGSVVEISAPGGETSLTSSNGVLSTLNTGAQGPVADTYVYYQGTSMAAPHVAGVVSLLYSLNPALTPAQVLAVLQSTATPFPAGSACNTSICGSGIVNAGAAVAGLSNPAPTISGINPSSVAPGGPAFTLTVNGAGFVAGSVVRWNGANRTTTYVSSTQLTAAIGAGDIAAAGTATITVFNPAPGGGLSNPLSFLIGAPRKIYLPAIFRNYPPLPGALTLNPISNTDGDGDYTVSWTTAAAATSYLIQEDDNSDFTSPITVYNGGTTSWTADGKAAGTYFYRGQGRNTWGGGPWSNVVSTVVQPPASGPDPGYWRHPDGRMEFYVTTDRAKVDRFAIRVNVEGCGSYKITHLVQEPIIAGTNFSFTGPFYASGVFSSQTAASGATGLDDFYIDGCGSVTGGPFEWTANWTHTAAQQTPGEAAEAIRIDPADEAGAFVATRNP